MTMMFFYWSVYLFGNIAKIGAPNIFWYGWSCVPFNLCLTRNCIDKNKFAFVWELAKIFFRGIPIGKMADGLSRMQFSQSHQSASGSLFHNSLIVTAYLANSFSSEPLKSDFGISISIAILS